MRVILKSFLIPAVVVLAGCSKDKPADTSLNNDLTLAAQARQNATLDSITAAERVKAATLAATPAQVQAVTSPAPRATAPATHRTATTTHRRATESSGSSSSTTGTSSGNVVAREPHTEVEKHTNRDAGIGAAAGAIIGATTSRNKVQGGIIGAAAGGILGAVIGNNVDKKKKTVP